MNFYNSTIKKLFMLLPFLEPLFFYNFSVIDNIYFIWKLVVIVLILLYILLSHNLFKLSPIVYIFFLYRLILTISTYINHGNVAYAFTSSIIMLFGIISLDLSIKVDCNKTITLLSNIFLIYMIINCISYPIINHFTISNDSVSYFLGIRTRFTDVCVPAIILSLVSDQINYNRIGRKSIISIILGAINILMAWVGTGVIGIALIIIFLLLKNKKSIFNFMHSTKALIFSLFINIGIVFFKIQNLFSFIIVGILHKSLTLSSRVYVWDLAIRKISRKPILGYGLNESGTFINLWGYELQTLNQILQLLAEGGIIALIIFLILIYICYKVIKKNRTKDLNTFYLFLFIFVMIIMMTTERYANYIYFYIPILILYGYMKGSKNEKS